MYPGLYPQRPIEAIELPDKSYLAPLFSYIAPLMSSKARRRLPKALSITLCLLFHRTAVGSWAFVGYLTSLSTRCLFPENPGLPLMERGPCRR